MQRLLPCFLYSFARPRGWFSSGLNIVWLRFGLGNARHKQEHVEEVTLGMVKGFKQHMVGFCSILGSASGVWVWTGVGGVSKGLDRCGGGGLRWW